MKTIFTGAITQEQIRAGAIGIANGESKLAPGEPEIWQDSGDPWKPSVAVIEELGAKRYPALLMPRDRQEPQ